MSKDLMKVAEDSARGGFFLFSGTLTATAIFALTAIIVARLLGPDLYGQYTLSLVLPEMLFAFAGFGIAQGVVKFVSGLRAEGKTSHATRVIEHAVLLRLLTGLPFFFINFFLADFLSTVLFNRPDLGFYIRIASITILFQVVGTSATSAFLGLDKTEYSALVRNLQAISKATISIGLVLLGFSVIGAIMGHVIGWIIEGIIASSILVILLRKSPKQGDNKWAQSFRTLMSFGIPLYFVRVFAGFIFPYQNLVLGIFASNVDIGNWKAAGNFLSLVTIVSIPITTALFPAFSKLSSTRKTALFFKFANKFTVLLVIPIVTLLIVFSNQIVQLLYGSTYQTAPFFLSIQCLSYFLVGLGYLNLTSLFKGLGQTKINLKMGLIAVITVIVLSPILANAYGVLGVITTLLIANVLSTLYGMSIARRQFQIKLDTISIVKTYLAAAVSSIPSLLLLQISTLPQLVNVIASGLIFLFVYVTIIPVVGIVKSNELDTITKVLKRIKLIYPMIKPLLKYQLAILNRQKSGHQTVYQQ